jgi:hypothetical protein
MDEIPLALIAALEGRREPLPGLVARCVSFSPELVFRELTEEPLRGLARRLGWITAGAALVSGLASAAPAWVGLVVLAIWFLPSFWQGVFLHIAAICAAAGPSWRGPGLTLLLALEEATLVGTIAVLGGSLL